MQVLRPKKVDVGKPEVGVCDSDVRCVFCGYLRFYDTTGTFVIDECILLVHSLTMKNKVL